jgi:signal transduction histidine kinase
MSHQISDPVDTARLQQIRDTLQAEIDEREREAAVLARRNAELDGELRWRLAESESIERVLACLLQKAVLGQVLDIVCTEAQRLVGASASAVLLLTDQGWLEIKHHLGKPLASVVPVPVDGSLAGQVVRHGEPVLLNDPTGFEGAYIYQWPADLMALLAVPLRVDGGIIGVLDVVNKPGGFTEEDLLVVSVFANQAAVAIEHARLQQQAEQLAVVTERQRVARELHDSVAQTLYSVTLYAAAAARALAVGRQDVTARCLQEIQEAAQESMRDMRLLIFQMHPPVLETEGLVAALQAYVAAMGDRAGLQTEFHIEGERRLPIAIESELFWIAQEALNRVLKHAGARHVSVDLHFTAATIRLEVLDDGLEGDPPALAAESRGGLCTIAELCARVGAKLTYESTPGAGRWVMVEVAL